MYSTELLSSIRQSNFLKIWFVRTKITSEYYAFVPPRPACETVHRA